MNMLNEAASANSSFDGAPKPRAQEQEGPNSQQYVTFACDGRAYGIDIMAVREIRSWTPTTSLPEQPFGALGVLDIRGEVVEVFDLSAMLGGGAIETKAESVVLVVSLGDRDMGILVDSVSDIIDAREKDIRKSPGDDQNKKVSQLVSHGDELVAILNLQLLFG